MDKLYFDVETTGPDSQTDRIVELAIKIVDEQGKVILNKAKRYNPEKKISAEATKIHGISNMDVKDCPTFSEDARKLKKLFEDKIIIGYNCMVFDIPILMNEFDRAGVEVELSGKYVDVFRIEQKIDSRTLGNVYKKYTGLTLENAHDASADINATHVILEKQIEAIGGAGDQMDENKLYELSGTNDLVDLYGKFKRDSEGYLIFNFGQKCKGKRVVDEVSYAEWMLKEKFPSQVKKLIKQEQQRVVKKAFGKNDKNAAVFNEPDKKKPAGKGGFEPVFTADDDLPF